MMGIKARSFAPLINVSLEDAGIRVYVPLPDWEHQRPYFGPAQFRYDGEHDCYICPTGQLLHLTRMEYTAQKAAYSADAATCNACPLKAQCTPSDHGRLVHRSFHASYLERVRSYHQTKAYQKAMRIRISKGQAIDGKGEIICVFKPSEELAANLGI